MVDRNEVHRSYSILSYQCYSQALAIIVPKARVPKLYLKDVNNLLYAQTPYQVGYIIMDAFIGDLKHSKKKKKR